MVEEVRGRQPEGPKREKVNSHPEQRGVLDTPITQGYTSLLTCCPADCLPSFSREPFASADTGLTAKVLSPCIPPRASNQKQIPA